MDDDLDYTWLTPGDEIEISVTIVKVTNKIVKLDIGGKSIQLDVETFSEIFIGEDE
jgi:hypothetical protein